MHSDDDTRIVYGTPGNGNVNALTATDIEIARRTGVAGVEILEHKKLKAAGAFKPGMERPLKYIILAD